MKILTTFPPAALTASRTCTRSALWVLSVVGKRITAEMVNTTHCLYAWRKYEFIPPKLFAAAKPWRLANARALKILEESFMAGMGSCLMDGNGGVTLFFAAVYIPQ